MIFDGALYFLSLKSPSVAHHGQPDRHLTQNWSIMTRNCDFENHILEIQGVSRSYQGHVRRSLEVSKYPWNVSKTFQNGAKHSPPGARALT